MPAASTCRFPNSEGAQHPPSLPFSISAILGTAGIRFESHRCTHYANSRFLRKTYATTFLTGTKQTLGVGYSSDKPKHRIQRNSTVSILESCLVRYLGRVKSVKRGIRTSLNKVNNLSRYYFSLDCLRDDSIKDRYSTIVNVDHSSSTYGGRSM